MIQQLGAAERLRRRHLGPEHRRQPGPSGSGRRLAGDQPVPGPGDSSSSTRRSSSTRPSASTATSTVNAAEFANLQRVHPRAAAASSPSTAATDSMQNVPWYMDLVGAGFTNHGSNSGRHPDRDRVRRARRVHQRRPGAHDDGGDARRASSRVEELYNTNRNPAELGIVHPLMYENEDSLINQIGYGTGPLHQQRPARDDVVPQLRRRPLLHHRARPQLAVHDRARGGATMILNAIQWTGGQEYANCVTFNEVKDLLDDGGRRRQRDRRRQHRAQRRARQRRRRLSRRRRRGRGRVRAAVRRAGQARGQRRRRRRRRAARDPVQGRRARRTG